MTAITTTRVGTGAARVTGIATAVEAMDRARRPAAGDGSWRSWSS